MTTETPNTPENQATMSQACMNGDIEVVKSLLSTGYDRTAPISWKDKEGQELNTPPIFIAVDYSHIPIVEALLQRIENDDNPSTNDDDNNSKYVDIQDENGYSPLCWSSWNGNLPLVELLLSKYNANVHQTSIDLAKEYDHNDIAKLLLQHSIDQRNANPEAADRFYEECHGDVDEIMLKASREGDVPKIRQLIEEGYDFDKWKDEKGNYQQFSPISVAYKCGNIEVIQVMVQEGGLELEMDLSQFEDKKDLDAVAE
ncbi:hypothetical protein ACHAXS_001370 [Conticribra weissflogii]